MKKKIYLGTALLGTLAAVLAATATCDSSAKSDAEPTTGQTGHTFSGKVTKKVQGKYLLSLPEKYNELKEDRWPLILFLHGSGERGTNLKLVKKHGVPKEAEKQKNFPFIVLSPQCPKEKWWSDIDVTLSVMAILDEVCKTYRVDTDRIYLTGLSMGGFGSWSLATQYPDRFAAMAVVCGGGNAYLAKRLRDLPTKIFHGAKDPAVPVAGSKMLAGALKGAGGTVDLLILPRGRHNIWGPVYSNPSLYEWFLQNTRSQNLARGKQRKAAARQKAKH